MTKMKIKRLFWTIMLVLAHLQIKATEERIVEHIVCLAEDATGMIWMGTEEGLIGYDGVGFERYATDNSGLTGNFFTAIWAEPNGSRLWLGLKSGLAVMDLHTRRIQAVPLEGFYNIADLAPADDGGLWVLNIEDRFAHLDLKTDSVIIYAIADFLPALQPDRRTGTQRIRQRCQGVFPYRRDRDWNRYLHSQFHRRNDNHGKHTRYHQRGQRQERRQHLLIHGRYN